jgi:hypothetical protein
MCGYANNRRLSTAGLRDRKLAVLWLQSEQLQRGIMLLPRIGWLRGVKHVTQGLSDRSMDQLTARHATSNATNFVLRPQRIK